MSLTLDELKVRLRAVEDAISARISGSGGVGGATTEFRDGDKMQRWAQLSMAELREQGDIYQKKIDKLEGRGRRAVRTAW